MHSSERPIWPFVIFLLTYAIGLLISYDHWALSLLFLAGSALTLYLASLPEERASRKGRLDLLFIAAAFYLPTVYIHAQNIVKHADERRFQSYLSAHDCAYADTKVIGYAGPACNDVAACSDSGEIEVGRYYCRATRRHITFEDFKEGRYGNGTRSAVDD